MEYDQRMLSLRFQYLKNKKFDKFRGNLLGHFEEVHYLRIVNSQT